VPACVLIARQTSLSERAIPEPARGQSGPSVLITRPEPGASETARRIAALHRVPVIAPLMTIRRVSAELPDPRQLQAVIASSRNAVACLPSTHRRLPMLAVGDATAERALKAGHSEVRSASGDARALAALAKCACDPAGAPLLLATGRGQGTELEAALRKLGFQVVRHTVYAAEPVAALPETALRSFLDQELEAALFFSAETARVFVRLARDAGLVREVASVDALAIGRAAAEVLAPLRWRRVRVALRPSQDELLALLP
jgi:uroporphyrinogen-III synthase